MLTKSALDDPLAGVRATALARDVALGQMLEYAEEACARGDRGTRRSGSRHARATRTGRAGAAPTEPFALCWCLVGGRCG